MTHRASTQRKNQAGKAKTRRGNQSGFRDADRALAAFLERPQAALLKSALWARN
jgi:hypothetical protein